MKHEDQDIFHLLFANDKWKMSLFFDPAHSREQIYLPQR